MPAVVRVPVTEAEVNAVIRELLSANEARDTVCRAFIGNLLSRRNEVTVPKELDLVTPGRAALPVGPLVACGLPVPGDLGVLLLVKLADEVVAVGVLGLILGGARGLWVGLTVDPSGHMGCAGWRGRIVIMGVYTPVGELSTIFKLLRLKLSQSVAALNQLAVALNELSIYFAAQRTGNGTGDGEEKHRNLAEMHIEEG